LLLLLKSNKDVKNRKRRRKWIQKRENTQSDEGDVMFDCRKNGEENAVKRRKHSDAKVSD